MSSRVFCIPGILFLGAAFVLSFITSISLPYLSGVGIATTQWEGGDIQVSGDAIQELRLGIWSYCRYDNQNQDRTCSQANPGYSFTVLSKQPTPNSNDDDDDDSNQTANQIITINASWTRGLVIHPVATALTFLAFILSFFTNFTITLICSLLSFIAAFVTLIAFAIDIALFAYLKNKMNDVDGDTDTAPGFWLTFVSFILLLLAGCTVCFGRRKAKSGDSNSYPMTSTTTTTTPWYKRFKIKKPGNI